MDVKKLMYLAMGLVTLLIVGWRGSLSMFYGHLMDYYGIGSVTQVAAFIIISGCVGVVASSLFGFLYDVRGPRIPLIVGGLAQLVSGILVWFMKHFPWDQAMWCWYLAGVFVGLVFPSVAVSVNPTVIKELKSKPEVALAIVQSGLYLGLTIWSPVISHLIRYSNVFDAYTTVSVVTAATVFICATIYGKAEYRRRDFEVRRDSGIGNRRVFNYMLIPIFFVAMSSNMILGYLALIVSEMLEVSGITKEEVVLSYVPLILGVSGLLQSVGGFLWGSLAPRIGPRNSILALYSVQALSAIAAYLLAGRSIWLLAVMAMWLRLLAFGGEPVIHMWMVPVLLGENDMGRAIGLQISVVMASFIVGSALGGLTRDICGSYLLILIVSSCIVIVALVAALVLVTPRMGWGLR